MTSAGADDRKHLAEVDHHLPEVNPCRRLQLVAVLLAIVGVLGIVVAVGNSATSPSSGSPVAAGKSAC